MNYETNHSGHLRPKNDGTQIDQPYIYIFDEQNNHGFWQFLVTPKKSMDS
jgi:hypothetical protein